MSRSIRYLLYVLLPVLTVTYLYYKWSRFNPPNVFCVKEINLGTKELGDISTSTFIIENKGDQALDIYNIRTSCSCTGLLIEENGKLTKAEIVSIPPHSSKTFVIQLSVRGMPIGSVYQNTIDFTTNDPKQPEVRLTLWVGPVKGGIIAVPSVVMVGKTLVGDDVNKIIEVWEDTLRPRYVEKVLCSDPDNVKVTLIERCNETGKNGLLIARVHLNINTSKKADIDATLHLSLSGEQQLLELVRVTGKVDHGIEVYPSSISLPRYSEQGYIWTLPCLIQTNNNQICSIQLKDPPEGFTVEYSTKQNAVLHKINITIKPSLQLNNPGRVFKVIFDVFTGQTKRQVEIPVTIIPR